MGFFRKFPKKWEFQVFLETFVNQSGNLANQVATLWQVFHKNKENANLK